tara:strand:+ start:520 stop:651 length:132 start_codon:yes stop_codon:yes gene_type:complete
METKNLTTKHVGKERIQLLKYTKANRQLKMDFLLKEVLSKINS